MILMQRKGGKSREGLIKWPVVLEHFCFRERTLIFALQIVNCFQWKLLPVGENKPIYVGMLRTLETIITALKSKYVALQLYLLAVPISDRGKTPLFFWLLLQLLPENKTVLPRTFKLHSLLLLPRLMGHYFLCFSYYLCYF